MFYTMQRIGFMLGTNKLIAITVFHNRNQQKPNTVTEDTKQSKLKTNSVKQDDPYKVYEHLQLSLEEVCNLSNIVNVTHSSEISLQLSLEEIY